MKSRLARQCQFAGVRRLVFVLFLVPGIGPLHAPTVAAQTVTLDQEIDLTVPLLNPRQFGKLRLVNQPQDDFPWFNFPVGPAPRTEDDTMSLCGCFLAAVSTAIDYLYGPPEGSAPWFSVPLNAALDASTGRYVLEQVRTFNPVYFDTYLSAGNLIVPPPALDWGYKPASGTCAIFVRPHALTNSAIPKFKCIPGGACIPSTASGVFLRYVKGLGAAAKARINQELLRGLPTLVVRDLRTGFFHTQVIAGWDNQFKGYMIVDPLGRPGELAHLPTGPDRAAYEDWEASIVRVIHLEPSFLSGNESWILVQDDPAPIELLAINPDGLRTGFDPATQSLLTEDPAGTYYQLGTWADPLGEIPPGDPATFLGILAPLEGIYRFQVIGTDNGSFTLQFSTALGTTSETVLETVHDAITKGQILKYELRFSHTAPSSFSRVSNFTPEARAGNDGNGLTDIPMHFDGSRSADFDGTIVSYSWDFGDGTTATGLQVSHVYSTPGTYTVTLTVTDDAGATASDTAQASIILSQQKPVANPSGPYLGFAASPQVPAFVNFDASRSFDPNGDAFTARWDFGDGSPEVTTDRFVSPHSYASPGKYTVRLVVNDGIEDSEPTTTTVEVLPPPASTEDGISVSPTCVSAGDQATVEIAPFFLVSPRGGWNFGIESLSGGPRLFTPEEAVGSNSIRLRLHGPESGVISAPLESVSFSFSSRLEFSVRFNRVSPLVSGTYQIELPGPDGGPGPSASLTIPCPPPANRVPLADAGGPYTGLVGQAVQFDGSLSSDPDGDALTYLWHFGDKTTGAGDQPQHSYPAPGIYFVTLVVNDGKEDSITTAGTRSFAKVIVSQVTSRPPACGSAGPSVGLLWPPDHKLISVGIVGVTDPDGDPVSLTITRVAQDEPVNGLGDGDTSPDAVLQGSGVLLRAERAGNGNGRVYQVTFAAEDNTGGSCTGTVSVCVPHDRRPGAACVDDGPLYDSLQP